MTGRRFVVPAISTGLMLLVLIGLGVWQVYRLHWKQRILADIDRAEAAPPVVLPMMPRPFQKVWVSGTLRPDLRLLYGVDVRDEPTGPVLGEQLIEPLLRPGVPPLLIDLGWVADRAGTQVAGPVRLTGYVRPAEHGGLFSARNDPAGRRFYTLDPVPMARALGMAAVAPYTLVVLGAGAPGGPTPAAMLPRPPNDHLSYAITWFGLAVVLAVIFGTWLLRAIREARTEHECL